MNIRRKVSFVCVVSKYVLSCRVVHAASAPAAFIANVMNELDPHSARKDNPEVIALHYAVFRFKDPYLSPHIFIASHNLEDARVPVKSSTLVSPDVRHITFTV
jgi:hypothetical protein